MSSFLATRGICHAVAIALLAATVLGACVSSGRLADQLFDQGSLVAAERAYLELLAGDTLSAKSRERALYHLGLIYALPTSPRHDPARARLHLERLLEHRPPSRFSLHASLVLALQVQANELRRAMEEEAARAESLDHALEKLRDEAQRFETEATDRRQQQQRRLAVAISSLRQEIDRLSDELESREQELERIKQIDLEGPP